MKLARVVALVFVLAGAPAYGSAVGERITPPHVLKADAEKIGNCYSGYARRTGRMGRVVVTVTLDADAKVTAIEFPPGIDDWQEETARCVVGVLRFNPGTRDGVPVASRVNVPIQFALEGSGEVTYLKTSSTEEEQEAALQACYPAGAISIATPQYRVTVDSRGRAVEVELAESSGDETLDRAGECFLRTIRYAPTKAGNEKITSTAVIPVTLRPPKRSTSTPPPGP